MEAFAKGVSLGQQQGHDLTDSDNIFTVGIRKALELKSFEHAALAIGTTKDDLSKAISLAIENGEGIAELSRRIDGLYIQSSRVRSLRIARTELTDVINEGTLATLRKEGFQQKEWATVIDGNERPTHAAAHGQVVGINETFTVGGSSAQAPGDPILPAGERINCRCLIVGAGLPEDRRRAIGEQFLRTHGALERRFVVSLRRAFLEQRDRVLSHFPS